MTGGAGFIGSNLVATLLKDSRVGKVKVVDDLSNGFYKNIEEFNKYDNFEFIEGDITDFELCNNLCNDVDLISHQAALGSVPRSIKNPVRTNEVNINGALNIFQAAKDSAVTRVVFAASSSTYGDSKELPKVEDNIGAPLSPYAITKLVNELYADVYARIYENFEYIGLRYFNVFGPKQDPHGAYAAVIPIFFKAALENKPATINGDGSIFRDFTYIDNAVEANIKALFTKDSNAVNQIYNVACGRRTTLNQLWNMICDTVDIELDPIHGRPRAGDIDQSLADISKICALLNYKGDVQVSEGLQKAFDWYKNHL